MVEDVPIKIQLAKSLSDLKPSRIIAVKPDGATKFSLYVTDKSGFPFPLDAGSGTITNVTNTDGYLIITGSAQKIINLNPTLLTLINNSLQVGDNITDLVNNAGYITESQLPNSTSIIRDEFNYISGAQIFTLTNNYYQVFSVEVQGQGALSLSQYTLISPNKIQINDTLNVGDYIVVLYGKNLFSTNPPYYTQAEVDDKTNKILQKVSGENIPSYTPIAVYNNLAYKFDNLNPLHQFAFLGFSVNGTSAGQVCKIQQIGELELLNWNLTPNKQYLASVSGAMQTSNNSVGFTKVVGYATTANSMQIIKDYTTINK